MGFEWRHDNQLSLRSEFGSRASTRARRAVAPCLLAALSLSGCEMLMGSIPENRPRTDADAQTEQPAEDSGGPLVPISPEFPGDAQVSSIADAGPAEDDGAVADGSDAGNAGSDAGDTPDAGVTDVDSGTLDAGQEHDAGSRADAGAPEDAGPPCTPTTWYADEDLDTYGNPAQKKSACEKPGEKWADRAGDCADHNAQVNRGQTTYFGTPYTASNGKASFDYDCSGQEEPWAGQITAPDACSPIDLCKGSGYEKTARTGTGVYAYCGSVSIMTCSVGLSLDLCTSTHKQTSAPFVCR